MYGASALWDAVYRHDLGKAKYLLFQKKVDPNKFNGNDLFQQFSLESPLLLQACELVSVTESTEMVELLISNPYCPADVNKTDSLGKSPIMLAVEGGNFPLARVLLYKSIIKVDLNSHNNLSIICMNPSPVHFLPLFRAIELGNIPMVQELIHAGADVNITRLGYKQICPPIYHALKMENPNMCRLLLEHGCNVTELSSFDRKKLQQLCSEQHISENVINQFSNLHVAGDEDEETSKDLMDQFANLHVADDTDEGTWNWNM